MVSDKDKNTVYRIPVISSELEHIVDYTAAVLAPIMGCALIGLPPVEVVLSNRAWYQAQRRHRLVAFRSHNFKPVGKDRNYTIGHEVTHLLHDMLNPQIHDAYKKDPQATNLVELVADYGGRIFSSQNHPEIEESKKRIRKVLRELDPSVKKKLEIISTGKEEEIEDFETHDGGYRAANFIFKLHGTKYFPVFARADVDAASKLLIELGYWRELFAPYAINDEYPDVEIIDGKPVEIIHMKIGSIMMPEVRVIST